MNSVRHLLSLAPEIERAFRLPRVDYRSGGETTGGVITSDHVLRYLYVNLYRKTEMLEIIHKHAEWQQILSIGVGYGFLPILIRERLEREVTGLDLPENLNVYSDLLIDRSIPVIGGILGIEHDWPIVPDSYDLIILGEVLEHLRVNPYRALRQIYSSLRPGGALLLTTPNVACLSMVVRLVLGRNVFEPFRDADLGNPTDSWIHIREYTLDEVNLLMKSVGFQKGLSYYSHCWDRYNPNLHKYLNSTTSARLRSLLRSAITKYIPRLRQDMFFVAFRPATELSKIA